MGFSLPTYTQIPNEVFDKFMPILKGSELKVLLFILRKTLGFIDEKKNRKTSDFISISQITKGTGLANTPVTNAINFIESLGLICTEKMEGRTTNFKLVFTDEPLQKVEGTIPESRTVPFHKVETQKETLNKSINKNILSFWIEKGNIKHSLESLNSKLKKKHLDTIKEYGEEKIKEAISLYSEVIQNPQKYWFSYRWPLWDFISRGIDKFLPEMRPLENYSRLKDKRQDSSGQDEEALCPKCHGYYKKKDGKCLWCEETEAKKKEIEKERSQRASGL